jgi:hypothetical protein
LLSAHTCVFIGKLISVYNRFKSVVYHQRNGKNLRLHGFLKRTLHELVFASRHVDRLTPKLRIRGTMTTVSRKTLAKRLITLCGTY